MKQAQRTIRMVATSAMAVALVLVAVPFFSAQPASDEGHVAQAAEAETLFAKGGKKPTEAPTATPEPTEVPPGGGSLGNMHVSFVTVTYGSTQDTYGVCKVGIVDESGNLIDGAQVTLEVTDPWAGIYTETTMEQTAGLGNIMARLELRRREKNSCGKRGIPEDWTCTVNDVYHFDYTYAPELNEETSGSDTCSDGPV